MHVTSILSSNTHTVDSHGSSHSRLNNMDLILGPCGVFRFKIAGTILVESKDEDHEHLTPFLTIGTNYLILPSIRYLAYPSITSYDVMDHSKHPTAGVSTHPLGMKDVQDINN